ncbi:MAG: hypothetical protein MUP03_01485, partial [Anaerolineales bacterium]|nr:hypothetical protein [Anaerolineales bacterium]
MTASLNNQPIQGGVIITATTNTPITIGQNLCSAHSGLRRTKVILPNDVSIIIHDLPSFNNYPITRATFKGL